ncbi:MAG: ABC transporter ATP-binding protein [Pseudomonadota bacterium]
MSEPAIHLKSVDLTLGDADNLVHVLKSVDLEVGRAETVGIVGPSGSGKTTLLMVLAGLERPDSGEVWVAGTRLDQKSEDEVAAFRGRNIGFVFQSFHLIANMTALENVAVPLELAGEANAFERAREELDHVGLKDRLTHYPGQLSGGEQQRVAVARALAPNPQILIADEPTGNLDTSTGTQISDLIFKKQRERGMTFVLVTHDMSLAALCDHQVRVRSGEVFADAVGDRPLSQAAE